MMLTRGKFTINTILHNIDMQKAIVDVPKEIDTSVSATINFAGMQYCVSYALVNNDWHLLITNTTEHLEIKIVHPKHAISPEICAYAHGEEIEHEEHDFIFIEILCQHVEHVLFNNIAKKYSKTSIAEKVGLIPTAKVLVRELMALTPKTKRPVWIAINNPTTDPTKINSQCSKVLASKKYKGYTPVTDDTGNIKTREHFAVV